MTWRTYRGTQVPILSAKVIRLSRSYRDLRVTRSKICLWQNGVHERQTRERLESCRFETLTLLRCHFLSWSIFAVVNKTKKGKMWKCSSGGIQNAIADVASVPKGRVSSVKV